MLNQGTILDSSDLKLLDGITLDGRLNTEDAVVLEQIRGAIRRGHTQFRPGPRRYERIALVGGGPSLQGSLAELTQLMHEGVKIVTMNGSYQWCLEHNLHPSMQIVMDARPHNARFVQPYIPRCRYLLASQCHPDTWDAVAEYPDQTDPVTGAYHGGVMIFHALGEVEGPERQLLDAYYQKQWFAVLGGTTVAIRSLNLLSMEGYSQFDLFGVDSCYLDGAGHAYEQPENARDKRLPFRVEPAGRPDLGKTFWCAPWHVKQLENLRELIHVNGDHFTITVHGDGLLAYMLWAEAESVDGDVVVVPGEPTAP